MNFDDPFQGGAAIRPFKRMGSPWPEPTVDLSAQWSFKNVGFALPRLTTVDPSKTLAPPLPNGGIGAHCSHACFAGLVEESGIKEVIELLLQMSPFGQGSSRPKH